LKFRKLMSLNCFHNKRKPMLGLLLNFQKPMNLNCLRNERKSILSLFSKYSEINEIEVVFAMSESQCWDCFSSFGNQWIWVAFAMSENRCWDVFQGL
jgi:hypothetical protein